MFCTILPSFKQILLFICCQNLDYLLCIWYANCNHKIRCRDEPWKNSSLFWVISLAKKCNFPLYYLNWKLWNVLKWWNLCIWRLLWRMSDINTSATFYIVGFSIVAWQFVFEKSPVRLALAWSGHFCIYKRLTPFGFPSAYWFVGASYWLEGVWCF